MEKHQRSCLRPSKLEDSLPDGYRFIGRNGRFNHHLFRRGRGTRLTYAMSSKADGGTPYECQKEGDEGQPETYPKKINNYNGK